ncbi:MAG TPA: hypothetical protein VGG75_13795 [Trebonia sp.]|jgi:hypothetical protein
MTPGILAAAQAANDGVTWPGAFLVVGTGLVIALIVYIVYKHRN